MTQILTLATTQFVLQVSDRLVTKLNPRLDHAGYHDGYFNKSIIHLTTDAIVAISFSGLAYLDGIPTDQWLVKEITGVDSTKGTRDGRPSMVFAHRKNN